MRRLWMERGARPAQSIFGPGSRPRIEKVLSVVADGPRVDDLNARTQPGIHIESVAWSELGVWGAGEQKTSLRL